MLMDLGSAVLSAETALELLDPEQAERVLLCAAPFVEGAVAAGVAARGAADLAGVAAEARRGLAAKAAQLGAGDAVAEPAPEPAARRGGPDASGRVEVRNPHGLHARPLARLVAAAAEWDAESR